MKSLRKLFSSRWTGLILIFGIAPALLYAVFIHPHIQQVFRFKNLVEMRENGSIMPDLNLVPASGSEMAELRRMKQSQLGRIKKISTREDLLRFQNILADAMASQARKFDLRVVSVDLQGDLIAGRYIPDDNHALDSLESMPGVAWNELRDPIAVPMLELPSIEVFLTVAGEYSQVFSYIESLSSFPARTMISGLTMADGAEDKCYRLDIRGFYYDTDPEHPLVQAKTTPDTESTL